VNTLFDVLADRIGEGKTLADAVKAPRMHTEADMSLPLEADWPAAVRDHLKRVGYSVRAGGGASLNAIERAPVADTLSSASR
jgi:hypothetical protein